MRDETSHPAELKLPTAGLKIIIGLSIWAAGSTLASAGDFVFDLENTGSTPISVQVTVHQQAANTLRFTVDQTDPDAYGDLRGLFLHINQAEASLDNLNFSFVSAIQNGTSTSFTPAFEVSTGLNSVGFSGLQSYDIAFEFGSPGIGGKKQDAKSSKGKGNEHDPGDDEDKVIDDINSITFDVVNTAGALNQMNFLARDMQYFMAARATSSWDGTNREGSSKLQCCGNPPPATRVAAPESTIGLLALAFGGLLWRRRLSS